MSQAFPTAVIGPRSAGRNYGVLHRSPGLNLSRAAEERIAGFSLSLAGWAGRARAGEGFAALFPLEDLECWAFVRGAHVGQGDLGVVAFANLVMLGSAQVTALGAGGATLLPLVPTPDGGFWAPEGVEVEAVSLPSGLLRAPEDELAAFAQSLEHADRRLEVTPAEDIEPAIAQVLARYAGPPLGWSTTTALPRSGAFEPGRLFALVASERDGPLAGGLEGHAPATLAGGRLVGASVSGPASWRAWRQVTSAALARRVTPEADRALSGVAWRRELAQAAPEAAIQRLLREAAAALADEGQILALIHRLAVISADLEPDLVLPVRVGLAQVFQDLLPADPSAAGRYLSAYLEAVQPYLGDVLPLMPALEALNRGAIGALRPDQVQALSGRGLATVFAARTCAALRGMSAPALEALIEGARSVRDPRFTDGARDVIVAAARALGGRSRAGAAALADLVQTSGDDAAQRLYAGPLLAALFTDYGATGGVRRRLITQAHGHGFETAQSPARLVALMKSALTQLGHWRAA